MGKQGKWESRKNIGKLVNFFKQLKIVKWEKQENREKMGKQEKNRKIRGNGKLEKRRVKLEVD